MTVLAWPLTLGLIAFSSAPAATDDDRDLDLASALARRGWIELAEELCARIELSPSVEVYPPQYCCRVLVI